MLLGFKTQLKVNNKECTVLAKNAGVRRFSWNWGLAITKGILDHNRFKPDEKLKFPSGHTLAKWFVNTVKPDRSWLNEHSSHIPAEALHDLADAWQDCFKKSKGAPRFKKKGKCDDSFTVRAPNGGIKVDHFSVRVPKVGVLRTYERLPQVPVKTVTISRHAGNWYISFLVEVEPTNEPKPFGTVGVDVGVLRFATLSKGEYPDSPKPLRKLGKKLSKLQWRNRNKVIGSKNWRKAQDQIAKLHKHIADTRKTYIHGLTSYLSKNHAEIVIEDLNVAGMMQNHKLSKAISDCGFYEFKRQLQYKTELYGSKLNIANRWYPSSKTCCRCGHKKESLSLSVRLFQCEQCGLEIDRDLNAAINLEQLGTLHPEVTPVDKQEPSPLIEAGRNLNADNVSVC